MKPIDRFKAAVRGGQDLETEINTWLKKNDLEVKDKEGSRYVRFVTEVLRQWKKDSEIAKKALLLQQRIVDDDESLHVYINKGLCCLIAGGIDVGEYCEKIDAMGGRDRLLKAIRKRRTDLDLGTVDAGTAARGILDVINHHRRSKIRIKSRKGRSGND